MKLPLIFLIPLLYLAGIAFFLYEYLSSAEFEDRRIGSMDISANRAKIGIPPVSKITKLQIDSFGIRLLFRNNSGIKLIADSGQSYSLGIVSYETNAGELVLFFEQELRITMAYEGETLVSKLYIPENYPIIKSIQLNLSTSGGYSVELKEYGQLLLQGVEQYVVHPRGIASYENNKFTIPIPHMLENKIRDNAPSSTTLFWINKELLEYPQNIFARDTADYYQLVFDRIDRKPEEANSKELASYLALAARYDRFDEILDKVSSLGRRGQELAPSLGLSVTAAREFAREDNLLVQRINTELENGILYKDEAPQELIPYLVNRGFITGANRALDLAGADFESLEFPLQVERILYIYGSLDLTQELATASQEQLIRNFLLTKGQAYVEELLAKQRTPENFETALRLAWLLREGGSKFGREDLVETYQKLSIYLLTYKYKDASLPQISRRTNNINSFYGSIASNEVIKWLIPLEYYPKEKLLIPGFWGYAASKLETYYKQGEPVRVSSKYVRGNTQLIILRGMYYYPFQISFNGIAQASMDNLQNSSQGWLYNFSLKTLFLKLNYSQTDEIEVLIR